MKTIKTAIIDIGSNTIRLVIYQYNKAEGLQELGNIKTVARLRNHILPNGDMSEKGINILKNTLKSFKKIMDEFEIEDVKAAATAAIRQAKNKNEIIKRMKKETGISIDLLSEVEEAHFGYLAVVNSMNIPSAVTIDIGGGSTEITLFKNKKLYHSISFPFGTVSLKQMFVSGDTINEEEKIKLHETIKSEFRKINWLCNSQLPVIAIGGSARNIAQIHQHLISYPISGVHQYEMTEAHLRYLSQFLSSMTFEELKQLDGLSSDRADIIEIALEVFRILMEVVGTTSFHISRKGLREGLIMYRISKEDKNAFNQKAIFEEQAKRIATKYGRTEKELSMLVSLAEQMYKESCLLGFFSYNEDHLKLIQNAAKLYAIGDYIELDSSNQHTFYLIANQSIIGMNHRERVKLALVASYKNRQYFNRFSSPFINWFSNEEMQHLKDFGALLKFVYSLNISKRCIVKSLNLQKKEKCIEINIFSNDIATAEMYQAERQKKHIEKVFKQPVQIQFFEEEKG